MSDITFKHHDPNVMLELWHVTKRFGGLTAVGDVSFKIKKGEIYALIGPNGAGKTTLFNLLTGVYVPTEGTVLLDGVPLNGKKVHQFVEAGIARTFQNIRLFKKMTVIDNVKTAMNMHMPVPIHRRMYFIWIRIIWR